MAATIHTTATAPAHALAQGLLHAIKERASRYAVYRRTKRELSALSDRELRDIGLYRGMIRRAALEAAYCDLT